MQLNRLTTAAALAAFVTLAASASAQSDRRLPIGKGEPMPMPVRTDTVIMRDTLRITDTVRITRTDTVERHGEVALPPITPLGRFYWGVDGGAAIPNNNLNVAQNTGWTLGALLGWDAHVLPFGLRLDGGYTRFNSDDAFICSGITCSEFDLNADPELWNLNINGKLHYPIRAAKLYATGGGTWNHYRGIAFADSDVNDEVVFFSNDWNSKWGWNAGGGVSFGFGGTSLFLEARYQSMSIGGQSQAHVPIVLGITF